MADRQTCAGWCGKVDILWESAEVQLGAVIARGDSAFPFSAYGLTDLLQDYRIARMMGALTVEPSDMTAGSELMAIYASADLAPSEVIQCTDSIALRGADEVENEEANRLVFPILDGQDNPVILTVGEPSKPFNMKVNRTFQEDVGWQIGFMNVGVVDTPAAPNCGIAAKYQGVWVG